MKRQLFSILIVIFLGFVGFSLVIPLFPPMLLDGEKALFTIDMSQTRRMILLGLLLSMYPVGQFFGCPLLGRFSDRFGRRRVLLSSLFLVIPTYIGAAIAVKFNSLLFLFISRFFCGLFGGNVTIAQAAIADISTSEKEKVRRFGWIVSVSATGFIFGPLIGGKLASIFSFDTPFWASALLSILALIFVSLLFSESKKGDYLDEVKVKEILTSVFHGIRAKHLRHIYSANALIYGGIFFFLTYFAPFLLLKFDFTVSRLGEVSAYLSLPICIAPLGFAALSHKYSTSQMTRYSAFLLAIAAILFLIPKSPYALFWTMLPIGIATAMVFTYTSLLVSDGSKKEEQGHALGVNQSVQVFTEACVTMSGGLLAAITPSLPVIAGAILALLGGFYMLSSFYNR